MKVFNYRVLQMGWVRSGKNFRGLAWVQKNLGLVGCQKRPMVVYACTVRTVLACITVKSQIETRDARPGSFCRCKNSSGWIPVGSSRVVGWGGDHPGRPTESAPIVCTRTMPTSASSFIAATLSAPVVGVSFEHADDHDDVLFCALLTVNTRTVPF